MLCSCRLRCEGCHRAGQLSLSTHTHERVEVPKREKAATHRPLDIPQPALHPRKRLPQHPTLRLNEAHRERLVVLEAREPLHDRPVDGLARLGLRDGWGRRWRRDGSALDGWVRG